MKVNIMYVFRIIDAIIDKQTFEYVQQLQENRKSINDKNEVKVPFKYSKSKYLF